MTAVPALTIASNNYLALASVLAESYVRHHPGSSVTCCVVDEPNPAVDYGALPFEVVFARDVGVPSFENTAFRFNQLELNTLVKPFALQWLRQERGARSALYFDPDILVLRPLDFEGGPLPALSRSQACLTPHICAPLDDDAHPNEITIRRAGVYNLGFLGIRLDDSTSAFLDWWADRLWHHGYLDSGNGLFVDQSWMDFAPCFLESVEVLRSPALNVAYWNLGQRRLESDGRRWVVEGEPARFVHFSGLDMDDLDRVSRHQDRLRTSDRPELLPLLEEYSALVLAHGHEELRGLPYAYGSFGPEGPPVPDVARRQLARVDPRALRWPTPFDVESPDSFYIWLTEGRELGDGAVINRLALAIWEESFGAGVRFPDVLGGDLRPFVTWLKDAGGAVPFGVDASLLDSVEGPTGPRAKWPVELEPARLPSGRSAQALLERYDLESPGLLLDWLNTPIACRREAPTLTRLALLVHSSREDLQRCYPDPLGADQQRFAEWFAKRGAADLSLASELVEPVKSTLEWS